MNDKWMKIGKAVAFLLPIIASTISAVVSSNEIKQITIEETKKHFNDYINNK